jgi:polyhydroxybutyrate depolymerase
MPFDGGAVALSTTSGTVRSTVATRDFWVAANGCNTSAAVSSVPDSNPNDGSTITRESFGGCTGGHTVTYLRVNGGGHTTPSLRYFTAGSQNRDLEGAEETWRWLREARRN